MSAELRIFIAPSPFEALWREAISQAASAQGRTIETSDGDGDSEAEDNGHARLKLMSGLDCSVPMEADLVLTQPPQTAEDDAQLSPPDQAEARRQRSVGFAYAAQLAAANVPVADSRSSRILVPEIGVVERLGPDTAAACGSDDALAMYRSLPLSGGERAEWKPSLFVYPGTTSQLDPSMPRMDLTGRARPLVLGPWITLPRGLWRMEARFEVDPEGGCEVLDLRWGVEEDLAYIHVDLDRPGTYSVVMERFWEYPGRAEFRIYARQPHFKGLITFLGCTVEHVLLTAETPTVVESEALPLPDV